MLGSYETSMNGFLRWMHRNRTVVDGGFSELKVTVDLQSAFRKMLCLRAALEKTMVNYISLES